MYWKVQTTIKNYLFDTNNEEETKKAILNALGDNPESSVTTTYRNAENENVTKRDTIQHIEPNMERRISNTPVNENNDLSISLFFLIFLNDYFHSQYNPTEARIRHFIA